MWLFCYFSLFFVSLYKGVLELLPERTWETFATSLIVLNILCEALRGFIITDFMSTML